MRKLLFQFQEISLAKKNITVFVNLFTAWVFISISLLLFSHWCFLLSFKYLCESYVYIEHFL